MSRPDPSSPAQKAPTMAYADLAETINAAFEARDTVNISTKGAVREAVETALQLLDDGKARVAEKQADGSWAVNQWLKKAVLLSFRLNDMALIEGGPGGAMWWDKVPSKFTGWSENQFRAAGFRAVPGAIVRHSAHIARHRSAERTGARSDAGGPEEGGGKTGLTTCRSPR